MKIKVSSTSRYSREKWAEFFPNREKRIDGFEFYVNEFVEKADFWFVIEGVLPDDPGTRIASNRMIFLQAEIARPLDFFCSSADRRKQMSQFARVYGPLPYFDGPYENAPPFLPWFINSPDASSEAGKRDFDFLAQNFSVKKDREISMILSSKTQNPYHRVRLEFAQRVSQHFGTKLDWFGNGVDNIENKWDGLAPYRHTIVLENSQIRNGITEKLVDSALCLTTPIYSGAPNVNDYFPDDFCTRIDVGDLDFSVSEIERVLDSGNETILETKLLSIRSRALDNFSLFHRIARLAKEISSKEIAGPSIAREIWSIPRPLPKDSWPGHIREFLRRR